MQLAELHVYTNGNGGRPFNPRTSADTTGLQTSLREIGQVQPIAVCPRWDGPGYYIISGHRRVTAARALGWRELEAYVRQDIGPDTIEAAILAGNAAEPPDPLRVAHALSAMLARGRTESECAAILAIPPSHLRAYLALLRAPQAVQDRLRSGEMTLSAWRALLTAPPEVQEQVAGAPADRPLTTGRVRRAVRTARAAANPRLLDDEAVVNRLNAAVGVLEDLSQRYAGGLPANIAWRVAHGMQRATAAITQLLPQGG